MLSKKERKKERRNSVPSLFAYIQTCLILSTKVTTKELFSNL